MVFKPTEEPIHRREHLWTVAETIRGDGHILNPKMRENKTMISESCKMTELKVCYSVENVNFLLSQAAATKIVS